MKASITLALIARNEEKRIERCLVSAKDLVDEIIVVDTGSMDNTKEIALAHGAKVIDHVWKEDFSEARNVSIRDVTTDWVLWLDADEWLDTEVHPRIRTAVESEGVDGYYLIRRDQLPNGFSEMRMLRLWRHNPELRFEGIIHEQFSAAAKESMRLRPLDVVFHHDGFAGASSQGDKLKRNISLLERQLERDPDSLYYQLCLADSYVTLGDGRAGALMKELGDRILALSEPTEGMISWYLGAALEMVPPEQLFATRTERLIKRAWSWFPHSPIAMWGVATVEARRNRVYEAYRALKAVEQMVLTGQYHRLGTMNPTLMGELLWRELGRLASLVGDTETQLACLRRLNELVPGQRP